MLKPLFTGLVASMAINAFGLDINPDDSSIHFISTKKVTVAETHHFSRYSGQYTEEGQIVLDIDLSSVQTGIEIRDERMRESLFDAPRFPRARFMTVIDPKPVNALQPGQEVQLAIEGQLQMHGLSVPVVGQVSISRTFDGGLRAVTIQPVVLNLADFEMLAGVETLRELAGLPSISPAVPVSFYLKFQ